MDLGQDEFHAMSTVQLVLDSFQDPALQSYSDIGIKDSQ
jgi:hypothetical protein